MQLPVLIVIPCYNESRRLDVEQIKSYLGIVPDVSLLLVDDGSSDTTPHLLRTLQESVPGRIELLFLERNCGKAEAVRLGMIKALERPGVDVGYWDADLATPLSELTRFRSVMADETAVQLVAGVRLQRMGADVKRSLYRHYPGRVIATVISMLLRLPTYDTQCGAKVFSRSLAEKIFAAPFVSSWLFDVELVARTIALHGREETRCLYYELPLQRWHDIGASKVKLSYLPRLPLELGRIWFRYRKDLK